MVILGKDSHEGGTPVFGRPSLSGTGHEHQDRPVQSSEGVTLESKHPAKRPSQARLF